MAPHKEEEKDDHSSDFGGGVMMGIILCTGVALGIFIIMNVLGWVNHVNDSISNYGATCDIREIDGTRASVPCSREITLSWGSIGTSTQ